MGEEGFSSDSSLLYHRGVPSAIVDSQVWDLPDQTAHPQPPAQAATPEAARPVPGVSTRQRTAARRRSTGPPAGLGNNDVRIGYVVTGTEPSPLYRNAIGDECVYVESGTGTVETVFGVVPYRTGDYVLIPRATDAPLGAGRAEPALRRSRPTRHIAPPKRYLSRYGQLLEHAPYCERDLHGPGEPFLVDGHRRRGAGQAPRPGGRDRRHPADLRHPPVRRRRLGRLPLPVHVQRRGLHADHRQGPPAAAGAPGLRGPQLRGLQLPARARSTTTRCRSRCPTTTPTSTATR